MVAGDVIVVSTWPPHAPARPGLGVGLTGQEAGWLGPHPGLALGLGRHEAGRFWSLPGLAPSLGWPKAGPFGLPPGLEPGLAGSEAGLPGNCFSLFILKRILNN